MNFSKNVLKVLFPNHIKGHKSIECCRKYYFKNAYMLCRSLQNTADITYFCINEAEISQKNAVVENNLMTLIG